MRRLLARFAVSAYCLALLSATGSAQDLTTVDIGLTGKTAGDWPLYVADSLGYFKHYGVNPNFIVVGSAAGNAQQLAAASLPIAEISPTQLVQAMQGGAPISYALNVVITPPYSMMAKSNIHSLADLKGKMVILGGVNDITRVFFEAMMKPTHLTPNDYNLTYAGSTNERYAALKNGSVDAAMLFPPMDFLAESEGYRNLGNVQKVLPEFPFEGYAINVPWAQAHRTTVVNVLKGYLAGLQWLYTPANRDAAIRILVNQTHAKPADASKTYDLFITQLHVFARDGRTTGPQFQRVLDALVSFKALEPPLPPPGKFFDNSYVDAASAALKGGR